MDYQIIPIAVPYIKSFHAAVDSVARERKYLAFLEGPSLDMSYAFVQENLRLGRPHFVAIKDETVIGWCDIASLHRPVFAHAGVLGIGVIANYRGQGIGEALIRKALQQARTLGLTRVELQVRENNKAAINLYDKIGFIREGLQRNAVRIDSHYENLTCMAILFDE